MKFLKQEDTIMCRNLLRVFCHEIIRKKRWILIYLKSSARKSSEKGDCYFFLQIVLLFLGSSLPKSSRLNLSSRSFCLKETTKKTPGGGTSSYVTSKDYVTENKQAQGIYLFELSWRIVIFTVAQCVGQCISKITRGKWRIMKLSDWD